VLSGKNIYKFTRMIVAPDRRARRNLTSRTALVRGKLLEDKGITLVQLRDWIEETLEVRVHISSVDRFIRSLGYSYKKNTAGQRARTY
jgi:transposase